MGTMPFNPSFEDLDDDLIEYFNMVYAGRYSIVKVNQEKDHSNYIGAALFILFLFGVYSWINGF